MPVKAMILLTLRPKRRAGPTTLLMLWFDVDARLTVPVSNQHDRQRPIGPLLSAKESLILTALD